MPAEPPSLPIETPPAPARRPPASLPLGFALAALAAIPLVHWESEFQATKLAFLVFAASAALAAWVRDARERGAAAIPAPRFFAVALALLAWQTFSIAWSPTPMRGVEVTLRVGSQLTLAWILLAEGAGFAALAEAAALPAALVSIYGILQWKGWVEVPVDNYGLPNISATMGLTNYASELLAALFPWMVFAVGERRGARRFALFLSLFLSLAYLLLAKNRASWLGFLAGGGILLAVPLVRGTWRPRPARTAAAAGGLVLLALLLYATTDFGADLADRFASIFRFRRGDSDVVFRLLTWKATVRMWLAHPLLGVGAEGLEVAYPRFLGAKLAAMVAASRTYVNRAHDEPLEILATFGAVGLALWLWVLARAGRGILAGLRPSGPPERARESTGLLASLAALLVTSLFSFNLQGQATGLVFWIAASRAAALREERSRRSFDPDASWLTPTLSVGLLLLVAACYQGFRFAGGELNHRRGSILLKVKAWDAAADAYAKAIRWYPYPPAYHFNLAVALANEGRLADAGQSLAEVIRLDPNHPVAHEFLGEILARGGRMGEAAREYLRAAEVSPERRGVLVKQAGEIYLVSGDAAAAYKTCAEAAEQGDPDALYCAAESLRPLGRSTEARDLMGKLLKIRPDYPGGHRLMGLTLRGMGETVAAAAELREAIRQDPHDGVAWYALATELLRAGHRTEAQDAVMRAVLEDASLAERAVTDPDFAPLRGTEAFRRMREQAKKAAKPEGKGP